jgi:hypothetical protein
MPELIFIKLDMYIMAPESLEGILHKLLPSVHVCIVASQQLDKHVPAATNTHNNRRNDGSVIFYTVRVVSEGSLWVCLYIYLVPTAMKNCWKCFLCDPFLFFPEVLEIIVLYVRLHFATDLKNRVSEISDFAAAKCDLLRNIKKGGFQVFYSRFWITPNFMERFLQKLMIT